MVLLSKLEETLIIDGQEHELSTNQYPGAIHPQGHVRLKEFRLDPFPIFIYEAANVQIEKSLFMVYGQDTTVIQYRLLGGVNDCRLEVRPLIAFRDYHATTHENSALNPRIEVETGNVKITPYVGLPSLYLGHCGEIRQTGVWYHNFEYEVERMRGLDYYEDLFNPLGIVLDLRHIPMQAMIASTAPRPIESALAARACEIERHTGLARSVQGSEFVRYLASAADQFIVKRGEGYSVIAGYHWFTDWGRDTMISLPGLALSTGRPELARVSYCRLRALLIVECFPIAFPMPKTRRNTIPRMPPYGFLRPCERIWRIPVIWNSSGRSSTAFWRMLCAGMNAARGTVSSSTRMD